MWIRILGASAGGGVPQWNCNCQNCTRIRSGELQSNIRTQSSIAVSGDGESWVLINASPDIRTQIEQFPALQPARNARDTAISSILLTDAQLDHTMGLLTLREGRPLTVYCTEPVQQDLSQGFPVLSILQHYCGVRWRHVKPDQPFQVDGQDALRFTAISLESNAPPYSPRRNQPHPEDNIGLVIESLASGRKLFYAPGLGRLTLSVKKWLEQADCLLIDGTFWRDDELALAGAGGKTARSMGHLPLSGDGGMLEQLRHCLGRKIIIHINNTNPIIDVDSPERAQLDHEGVEVAFDGMDIRL